MGNLRRLIVVGFLVAWTSAAAEDDAFEYGDPTAEEQMILERINAVRADPGAFGYGSYEPRQPLVMEARLLDAARTYATYMADEKWFDHVDKDGLNANGRLLDAGYPLPDSFVEIGKTQDESNTVENIGINLGGNEGPQRLFESLLDSEGHRKNILSAGNDPYVNQAGIGIHVLGKRAKVWDNINGRKVKADQFMAQEFAHETDTHHYLLGVVYADRNGNGEYDAGEGASGVTIRTTDGAYSTTTKPAGGYGIRIDTPGTYTLEASGGALPEAEQKPFTIASENVKVDFVVDLPETFELVKCCCKVDFKKRRKGKSNVDSLKLTVRVDPGSLPETLHGVTATVVFGEREWGPYTLSGDTLRGVYRSSPYASPKVKIDVRRSTGLVILDVKRGDLMDDLGIANETSTGSKTYGVGIVIGTAFSAEDTIDLDMKCKQDKKAKGKS